MTTVSRAEACVFIDKLREDNGGITREDREFLERNKPQILATIDNIRRKLGASTKALAANLYAKDTRFVYELIQNAEDNSYEVAKNESKSPWLRFALDQDRIVIDSNEDGFSEANIRAICSIGESTKASIQGYIGEKGIGFKSVFKVARKVHVQSGPYSFAFEYQRDGNDNGLGMVTPMNEDYLAVPGGVRTRIILYLLTTCDRNTLRKEFLDLPDTLLLFLRKLKTLSIKITIPGERDVERNYSLSKSGNEVSLHKTLSQLNSTSTQNYWTARRQVSNMPNNYARKNISMAEVVLAFPLDADDIPIIEDQHVFAFLPLRKVGYKFLIQSDFITQASREDVFNSPWNNRLLDEVTETFLSSVGDFLNHPTLRYCWLRFIPTGHIADDFWGRLQVNIFKAVSSRKLFFDRYDYKTRLSFANKLRIVPHGFRDEEGHPLLADLTYGGKTAYVSEQYDKNLELPILKKIGAEGLSNEDFLDRLAQDLNFNDVKQSRMRSKPLSAEWHTDVASLLIVMLRNPIYTPSIGILPIVPLNTGRWVSPRFASIYFPTSEGIEVPADLGLALVDTGALRNNSRKTLFSKLGVTECDPSKVFPLIEQVYLGSGQTFRQTLPHISFIFWHHTKLPTKGIRIKLLGSQGSFWSDAPRGWTYNPCSEAPYSMSKILGTSSPIQLKDKMRFLKPTYEDELQHLERRNDQTIMEWLASFIQMKEKPQLCRRSNTLKMSSELKYIIQHRPQFLLGVLEANWHQYSHHFWDLYSERIEVPVLHSDQLRRLDMTYLPLPKLMNIVVRLGLEQDFGFLKELDGIVDSAASKWMFLRRFGVGIDDDLSFWLALLNKAKHKNNVQGTVVFEIYTNLQKFLEPEEIEEIKEVFSEDAYVFLPSANSDAPPSWRFIEDCVWDGPEWFTYKARLQTSKQYRRLYSLFRLTLGVKHADYNDYLAFLQTIQNSSTDILSSDEHAKVLLLYEQLYKVANDLNDFDVEKQIRTDFEENNLVYSHCNGTWHTPSFCIWAEEQIQLPGKLSIATTYKTLKPFFLNVLRVTKPSLEMHISALKQKASTNPDKSSIFREMLNICAFEIPFKALEKLRDCKCLPIKLPSGTTEWSDCSEDFAIVNRRDYSQTFAGQIKVLNFSLEEVHSLKPFLTGLGLEERYLSRAVREETTVQGGLISERLTAELRKKSYAICRYAAHLGSKTARENAVSMHRTLHNMDVYVSDAISKSVSIDQNDVTVTVPQATAYFHLDQQEGKLKLYVPQSKNQQRLCLSRELPISLLQHFGVPKDANGAELGSIITESSLFVINGLLEQAGIIEVGGITRPEDESEDESSSSGTANTPRGTSPARGPPESTEARAASRSVTISTPGSASQTQVPGLSTGSRASTPSETVGTPRSTSQTRSSRHGTEPEASSTPPLQTSTTQDSYPTPNSIAFDRSPSPPERPDLYRELLDAVVELAESLHRLPRKGQTFRDPLPRNPTIGVDTSLAVHSSITGEREFKIGAAGELFVFELLKGLGLPNFTLANWQSTIRHRVAVHERYYDLTRWFGPETADIVYRDREGTLTHLLIEAGYLQASTWSHKTPEYYIEVKTTVGMLDTPFYCSQPQYERMESMRLLGNVASNKVYLVARVFSLGDCGMGLKLYMDPATLRSDQELIFKTDKYSVTPGYRF
ncbi:uncharacterized protein BDZ99DRAFT_442610 [Mytilinidion resinicola]|uniref:Protein NO VEIN C-terminal domain-containing protein n=1 Tax=Mytilinidion resinicola TaxID=574789 RepID=A0A6A6YMK1_9PEZI|nr:uncharacterized protein BDZ99DRAFT_442610 [Mytilinidion resinicola]KAF2810106.1 hypothetical protein BDZ99DRAFT_442610 [Mytilinidion resinicola]